MIERFNFYDLYGYLLPGLALLILFWLPFGLVAQSRPASELSSAVAALAVAYIVGHLLQTIAANAIPSQVQHPSGRLRHPSDVLLDPAEATFSQELRTRLAARVSSSFGLGLELDKPADEAISKKREDAFLLCRQALIKDQVVSYAEQFEGLYAMMRGLTVAFGLGGLYLGGWALSLQKSDGIRTLSAAAFLLAVSLAITTSIQLAIIGSGSLKRFAVDRATLGAAAVACLASGYWLGSLWLTSAADAHLLLVAALLLIIASIRCFAGYRYFAEQFAKAVWRHFAGVTP